jgi:uncharacterized protein
MKKLILLFRLAFIGASLPKPEGFVNDFAGVVSYNTKNTVHSLAYELQQKSGAQLAVVTVKSLEGLAVEDYAWKLFENWGIGEKGTDTGVLLLVAPNDKKLRIEVGYGFEGAIPDGLAGEIIRKDIIPYFKKGEMDQGILRGSLILLKLMAEEMNVSLSGEYPIPQRVKAGPSALRMLLNLLFIFLILGGRWFFFPIFLGGGRGYYSGGGGGFGGFGGFGGGLSGGGGASGSW